MDFIIIIYSHPVLFGMHRNARSVPLPSFRLSVSPSALIYFSPPQPDSFPFASVHEASRKGETKHEVRFLEHSSLSLSLYPSFQLHNLPVYSPLISGQPENMLLSLTLPPSRQSFLFSYFPFPS